jgi:hypothetical protein
MFRCAKVKALARRFAALLAEAHKSSRTGAASLRLLDEARHRAAMHYRSAQDDARTADNVTIETSP